MELIVKQKVNVSGWFLTVFFGGIAKWWCWEDEQFVFNGKEYTNIEDFEEDYPYLVGVQPPYYSSDPKEGIKTLKLCIDLCTGKVLNWPEGINFDFNNYKLVDTGRYEIPRQDGKLQAGYTGYVPSCFSIDDVGYGDYLQFHIQGAHVVGWDFDQDEYDQFLANCDE